MKTIVIRATILPTDKYPATWIVESLREMEGVWSYIESEGAGGVAYIVVVMERWQEDYVMKYVKQRLKRTKVGTLKMDKDYGKDGGSGEHYI